VQSVNEFADKDATSLEDIFLEACDRLKIAESAESDNRDQGLKALDFVDGNQWDADIQKTRTIEARPALTINHTNTFCRRIENTLKQQRPRIKCQPTKDSTVGKAKRVNGLIRHIETNSNASIAYDAGGTSAINIGWGYWRIGSYYLYDKGDKTAGFNDQELTILPIFNTFTVYMDPNAVMPAGEDQQWCIISTVISRREYKRLYPNAPNTEWVADAPGDMTQDWESKEQLRLGEYFRIHEVADKLYLMEDGSTRLGSEMAPDFVYEAIGNGVARDRKGKEICRPTTRRQVEWYRLNGKNVVEKKVLAGRYIPVIRCQGNTLDINGRIKRKGMVKDLMDPARMYNYWRLLGIETPVLTTNGWSSIGALRVGDEVYDEHGKPTKVIGKSNVKIREKCYRITFGDGSKVTASWDHPWPVEERGKRTSVSWTWTKRMALTHELTPKKHFIEVARSIEGNEVELPVHPYLLGLWLGDGDTNGPRLTPGNEDFEEIQENLAALGYQFGLRQRNENADSFTILGQTKNFRQIGVLGQKHIPNSYLRASESQRWALLRGFMDSDGSIGKSNKQCSYTTTNRFIADGFKELVRSLGIRLSVIKREGRRSKLVGEDSVLLPFWQFSFSCYADEPVFGLKRKQAVLPRASEHRRRTKRHSIVSVEPVASVPLQCIGIDTPTHLFLCGESLIPTHNTAQTEEIALAPKAPWVAFEGTIDGHDEWHTANTKSYSVLVAKAVKGPDGQVLPLPQRQQPAQVSAGFSEAAQGAASDLMAVAGMPQEDPQIAARVVSGDKHLQRRQGMADLTHWHFYDNQTYSIMFTGIILLDLIPYYYDTKRQQRIIGDDETAEMITINDGNPDNDMTTGSFDVVMDTGPGYATKREEGADDMMNLLGTPLGEVVVKTGADVVLRNMDFPGADILADRAMTTNPEAMDKAVEGLPDQAKNIIGALKQQVQQAQEQIQHLTLELKYKAGIEQMKDEGQTKRTLMTVTAKAHDIETAAKSDDLNSARDYQGWVSEVDKNVKVKKDVAEIQRQTALDVAEIKVGGDLLNSHVEAAHEAKAADKALKAAQTDRPTNGSNGAGK
jgi:hypothetical protein